MMPGWLAGLIFLTLLGVVVGAQVFWFQQARDVVRRLRKPWQRWLLGAPLYAWFLFLAILLVLIPVRWLLAGSLPVLLSFFMVFRRPELMVPAGLWMAASTISFLLIGAIWSIAALARRLRRSVRPAPSAESVSPGRRDFLRTATYVVGASPFAMVGYSFLRRRDYVVQEVAVPLPNLPQALDGLRLLQLTDVHAGAYMSPKEIRRVVGMAREFNADLVFHTGDLITGRGDPLDEAIDELSRVQGRYGSFGCLGNHEIFAGAENYTADLFARRGVHLLRGRNVELEINGARLNLIGVDYQRQPRGLDPERWASDFLRGIESLLRPEMPNILLTHNPNPFIRASELGIDLTLAGHTHGGQMQMEFLDSRLNPARFITPFVSGLYERNGCRLYVSAGIGTIAAPIRVNAPPEISVLTLRRA